MNLPTFMCVVAYMVLKIAVSVGCSLGFMHVFKCERVESVRLEPVHEKRQAGLTNLVFPFHGKFHHQLLGVGANEDKWRSRLLADLGILKRERGNNELCSATWLPRTESTAALKGFSSP